MLDELQGHLFSDSLGSIFLRADLTDLVVADMDPKEVEDLQIHKYKQELLEVIRKNRFLVIVGDTGSGKTTQIPQYLLDVERDGKKGDFRYKRIVVTQPRRVATISAARRVCDERGLEVCGAEVGYSIRFDKCVGPSTRLVYTTDGTALRELISNPKAENIDVIILDEAHERDLQTDVLIGFLRRLPSEVRPDLKVIIMSATIDYKRFSKFFDNAPIFMIPGRQYPVEVHWLEDVKLKEMESVYVSLSVETVYQIHINEGPGSILVFLTGRLEIERAIIQLKEFIKKNSSDGCDRSGRLHILPIFSSMEMGQQRLVFEPAPPGYRKVIFSTNIAQTSITIPEMRYIVDSGFVKQKVYDTASGMDALVLMPISRTASIQRAGRAGRTAPGKVYRLYSQEDFKNMRESTIPQIQTNSLVGTILLLKQMGVNNIINFPLIDPPDPDLVVLATKQLYLLGAIDRNGIITKYGEIMNMFPISPFLSKTIVSAALDFGYLCSVIDIVSMLSTENIFVIPNSDKKKQAEAIHASLGHETGDHLTLLNIMNTWRARGYSREWCGRNYMHYRALDTARRISEQLRQICCTAFGNIDNTPKKSHPYSEPEAVLRSFCSGFYMNTAKRLRKSGVYYHYLTSLLVKEESHSKSDTEPNAGSPDYHNLQPLVCNTAYKDTGLLALFLHQTSMLCNRSYSQVHALGDSDAEWLIYKDLYYCKRPMMRVVSKIQYSWVDKYMDLPLRFIDYNLLSGGNPKTPASTTDGITSSASFSGGPDKEPLGPEPSGHSENDVAPLNPKSGDSACFRRHGRDHIELERPHKTSKDRDDTERQLIIDAARDRYEKRKKLRNR